MILTCHLLAGAAIASKISNPIWALLLAFLSHYFLDVIPHWQYSIENIRGKQWEKSLFDFLKVFLDILAGILLIFIFSKNQPIIYAGAFLAISPDGLTLLGLIFSNKLLEHNDDFHQQKIHFLKYKKIPRFWRIFSQVLISGLAIFFL